MSITAVPNLPDTLSIYYVSWQIQPAFNPDGSYDWMVAVDKLANKSKHVEPLRQMEYTETVGQNDSGDINRIFDIEELAHTARFGVERIVMEFRKAERKFDKFDDRMALRFADMKHMRIDRFSTYSDDS